MDGSGARTPQRLTISSGHLPGDVDERTFRRHLEESAPYTTGVDFYFAAPYSWRLDAVSVGPVIVERLKGSVLRGSRTARHVAADGRDRFLFTMNRGGSAAVRQGRRGIVLPPGSMTLLSFAEPAEIRNGDSPRWLSVHIPGTRLTRLVRDAEDVTASKLPVTPAAHHLRSYIGLVLAPKVVLGGDPHLDEHVATTLTDLTALALGARRDEAELARLRGLHAARLALANEEIRRSFNDPEFSVKTVAAKLFVSPRTLQDLLYEAGASFTERVLELRLQKARQMLESPEQRDVQVAKIAYACGFRDVSYFNRCFRRRFGASPRELRT